jgi:hypothetical protein
MLHAVRQYMSTQSKAATSHAVGSSSRAGPHASLLRC